MFVATIQKATAAGILSYQVPQNCSLHGVLMSTAGFISWDPTLTGVEVAVPLADGLKNNVLVAIANANVFILPVPIQLSAGEILYLAFSGKGTASLYFV